MLYFLLSAEWNQCWRKYWEKRSHHLIMTQLCLVTYICKLTLFFALSSKKLVLFHLNCFTPFRLFRTRIYKKKKKTHWGKHVNRCLFLLILMWLFKISVLFRFITFSFLLTHKTKNIWVGKQVSQLKEGWHIWVPPPFFLEEALKLVTVFIYK